MNGRFGREAINEFIVQHINEHRGFFLKGGPARSTRTSSPHATSARCP